MIINSLQIYGFGKLSDVTIKLEDGINIIEGKNEAGKSTIMAFIRAILFGFEGRRNFHKRYEPIHGGKFGGVIFLSDQNKDIYRIERIYHQKVSGDVQITLPSGEIVGEEYITNLLGKINENIFKQIFCFGLTELQQIDLLDDNQINDFIYHAGTGAVNQILKMKQDLENKKQLLYRSGGKKPKINELINNLGAITESIENIKQKNKQHDSYLSQIITLEQDINNYEIKSENIKKELNKLKILERSYTPYTRVKGIEILLREYPDDFNFPVNGVERLDDIVNNIDQLKLESDQLFEKKETTKGEIIDISDISFYENNKELIINIKEQLNAYLEQVKSEQSQNIELQRVSDSIEENLKQIGSSYTEEKIRDIEISLQEKQYIQEQANKIDDKQKQLNDIDKEIELTKKNSNRVQNMLEDKSKEQERGKYNDKIQEIYPWINKYWLRLRENEWQKKNITEQKQDYYRQLKSINNTPLLSIFIINGLSIIGSIALVFFLNSWLYGSLLIGASIAISLFFRVYKNKINKSYRNSINNSLRVLDNQLNQIDSEIIQIKNKSSQLLNTIGFDEINEITFQKIDELRISNLQEEQLQYGEQKRIKEYYQEIKQYELDLDLLENKKSSIVLELNDLKKTWDEWLVKHSLPVNMSINILNNLIVIIQKLKELYSARDNILAHKKAINTNKDDFETKVNNLLELNNLSMNATLVEKVNYFSKQLKFVEDAKMTNSIKNDRIEEINERIDKITKMIELENQKYEGLLKYANVSDKEEFYKLDTRFKQYSELIEEQQQHIITIRNNCHNEYNYEQIINELEHVDNDDLVSKIEKSVNEIKEISEEIKGCSELKGEIQNKIKEIENDSTISTLNQEYAKQTTELTNKVKDWTALSLSKYILENTMKIYEEEKQPYLLQGASKFFSEMTGNEYIKIVASIGTNEIRVIRKDGVQFEPQYLSRGTVEQLFLAIRYALVEEYSKQNRLPIILDDIFVNFDSERLNNTIETLDSLSNKHQVIIFTCHTYVSQKIKGLIKELNYTNISTDRE